MVSADNATYTYNAQGLRVAKTVGNDTDSFILVGGNVWADSENNYLRGIELIYNGAQLYLYNVRGDVIQLADRNGNVVKTYDYDAYGNEYARDLGDSNPFRYCGEYYDTETGFIYLRARYYDPMVGRFTSVDPIKSGLNWYSYCDNNPVTRIDPTGEAWYHWALGALVVAACAAAVVITAGGVLAGATAVGALASGVAMSTTSTTIAAGAFLGSATIYGGCVLSAGFESNSIQEFNDKGDWGTVAATVGGAAVGGAFGYLVDRSSRKADISSSSVSESKKEPKVVTNKYGYRVEEGHSRDARIVPNSLNEQLAMEQVQSNPLEGARNLSTIPKDPIVLKKGQWLASDGWVKMANNVRLSNEKIEIHFLYNVRTGVFADFKFK